MVVPVGAAINAYNSAKSLPVQDFPTTEASGGMSFGDVLKGSLESTINTLHTSEDVSAQALIKKASPTDVVTAVTAAEVALQETSAVRDKVVEAYKDIMSMPI